MYLKIFIFFFTVIFSMINANDTPGFFLKISKNVPRLGRRSNTVSDFENFFLKASKSVPRIGRRDESYTDSQTPEEILINNWYNKFMMQSPIKRTQNNNNNKRQKSYTVVQPLDSSFIIELISNNDITPNDLKFIAWNDLDLALQNDEILFEKLFRLGKAEHEVINNFPINYQMDHFMPLGMTTNNKNNFNKNDYYKTDNKESIKYQL